MIQQRATPLLQAQGIEREEVPLSATGAGFRTSPPLFGLGLVEAVPAATILANEDPEDSDGDGISGRANRFLDGRLGRFGRKAFLGNLFDFTADAYLAEQSITSPVLLSEETINGQPIPPGTDPAPDPEIPLSDVEAVTDFVRFLAPPARRTARDAAEAAAVFQGEQLFRQIGCARCHIPSMRTGPSVIPALSNKTVFLYSDLLLHDMGADLADICLGSASPAEFRTEMLMGLRFRNHFLHDRRVFTVRESIELHGGEASASRLVFEGLSEVDQAALLSFLDTL
ncbi:MAG: di-heme oxidoredictase family protein [Terriglobia bacterium]